MSYSIELKVGLDTAACLGGKTIPDTINLEVPENGVNRRLTSWTIHCLSFVFETILQNKNCT